MNKKTNAIKLKGMKLQNKIIKKSIKHKNKAIKSKGTKLDNKSN
jgi:hypothetical protein